MHSKIRSLIDDQSLLAAVVDDPQTVGRRDHAAPGWLTGWLIDRRVTCLAVGDRIVWPEDRASLLIVRQGPWLIDFIELQLPSLDRREAAIFVTLEISPRPEPVELAAIARLTREPSIGDRLTARGLALRLETAVAQAVRSLARQTTLVDLVERPDSNKLLALLRPLLTGQLFEIGLEFVNVIRFRVESDDYEQSRQAERHAARAEEAARLQTQLDNARHTVRAAALDRLSEVMSRLDQLGERISETGDARDRARQLGRLLGRLAPAEQQSLVVGSLELSEEQSAEPPSVLLAAGSSVYLAVPGASEPLLLAGLDELPEAIGPVRWIGFDCPRLLIGARDGLAMAIVDLPDGSLSSATQLLARVERTFPLPAGDDQSGRRGGVNSVASDHEHIVATHSEVGLIAWPIDGSDRAGRILLPAPGEPVSLRPTITGLSMSGVGQGHSVRAVSRASGGGFVFSVDNAVLQLRVNGAPPVSLLTVRTPVVSLAVDGDELYVGEQSGHVTRLADGRAETVATLGGPVISIQPIVHGWLTRLLVSAAHAGLALVQPDSRLTTVLADSGGGMRQAVFTRGWVVAISGRRDRIVWHRRFVGGGSAEPDASLAVFSRLGHSAQAIAALCL